jgi:hypothetical protein
LLLDLAVTGARVVAKTILIAAGQRGARIACLCEGCRRGKGERDAGQSRACQYFSHHYLFSLKLKWLVETKPENFVVQCGKHHARPFCGRKDSRTTATPIQLHGSSAEERALFCTPTH